MIPANGGYATAAYVAAAVIYVLYAVSLRARTLALRSRERAVPMSIADSR